MTEGKKDDGFGTPNAKLQYHLIPQKALAEVVRVLMYGANRYGAENWRRVEPLGERYFDAGQRHEWAWKSGEKKDAESGLSHLAHAICCALFRLEVELETVRLPNAWASSLSEEEREHVLAHIREDRIAREGKPPAETNPELEKRCVDAEVKLSEGEKKLDENEWIVGVDRGKPGGDYSAGVILEKDETGAVKVVRQVAWPETKLPPCWLCSKPGEFVTCSSCRNEANTRFEELNRRYERVLLNGLMLTDEVSRWRKNEADHKRVVEELQATIAGMRKEHEALKARAGNVVRIESPPGNTANLGEVFIDGRKMGE